MDSNSVPLSGEAGFGIIDTNMHAGSLGQAHDDDDDSFDGGDGGFGFGGFDDYSDDEGPGGVGGGGLHNRPAAMRRDGLFEDSFDPTQGLNVVGAGRHVDKVRVGYETRAKRVDVRALKKSLWRHITHEAPRIHLDISSQEDVSMHDAPVDDGMLAQTAALSESRADADTNADDQENEGEGEVEETLCFSTTVGALAPDQAAAVTVPFYFICVLHLANERGLELKGAADLSDFRIAVEGNDEDVLAPPPAPEASGSGGVMA
jgi:condensin complex subunit 2